MKQKQEVQNRFHIVNLELNRCVLISVPWVLYERAQNPIFFSSQDQFSCNLQVPLQLVTKPEPGYLMATPQIFIDNQKVLNFDYLTITVLSVMVGKSVAFADKELADGHNYL